MTERLFVLRADDRLDGVILFRGDRLIRDGKIWKVTERVVCRVGEIVPAEYVLEFDYNDPSLRYDPNGIIMG